MSKHPVIELFTWLSDITHQITYERVTDLALHAPQYYAIWWKKLFHDTPEHVFIETTLIVFIIWLVFIRKTIDPKKTSKQARLTEKEQKWLIESWQPEPLVPEVTTKQQQLNSVIPQVEAVQGLEVTLKGYSKPVLNVSSFDFLGLGCQSSVKNNAIAALEKYGCGSCGPRGFYGSIDQHIIFEREIASFMGTQEAILYSDGTSISSTIPAFSKKGDILIVDEACYEPIRTGCNLSRSTIHFFKHNDMDDLAAILKSIAKEDKKLRVDTTQQRRFIVTEGVFRNTGTICNLPEILRLGKEFYYRLIVDESLSFGTLGKTGHGVTEHYGISIYDIDIICFALDTALASIGGVCIGTNEIVDHQRLSGAGYCFSASAPPFLSSVAVETLHLMQSSPQFLRALKENSFKLLQGLSELEKFGLVLMCPPTSLNTEISPVFHLVLNPQPSSKALEEDIIVQLYSECLNQCLGVSLSRFALDSFNSNLRPSIRLNSNALYSDKDIKRIIAGLTNAMLATRKTFKM